MKIHVYCTYKYTLLLTKDFLSFEDTCTLYEQVHIAVNKGYFFAHMIKLSVVLTICEGVAYICLFVFYQRSSREYFAYMETSTLQGIGYIIM